MSVFGCGYLALAEGSTPSKAVFPPCSTNRLASFKSTVGEGSLFEMFRKINDFWAVSCSQDYGPSSEIANTIQTSNTDVMDDITDPK